MENDNDGAKHVLCVRRKTEDAVFQHHVWNATDFNETNGKNFGWKALDIETWTKLRLGPAEKAHLPLNYYFH